MKLLKSFAMFLVLVMVFTGTPLGAVQEIKEVNLINRILKETNDDCKKVLRAAYHMREQALPFSSPKYQEKFRFQPNDGCPRDILSISRTMRSRIRMLSGILYHVPISNRNEVFTGVYTSLTSLDVSAKRALRAIRDGNFALYMISSQTSDKEARNIHKLVGDFEDMINQSIERSDATHENL